jgi:hypothetical protein
MFQLKNLHSDAVPRALERAERYRLLNEPWEAESICRDIVASQPDNQGALVTLLLALTDQFAGETPVSMKLPRDLLPRLQSEYDRRYYWGVICERWAKSCLGDGTPGHVVHDWFVEALRAYEEAERLSPPGNEDAILRWNACVRLLEKNEHVRPLGENEADDGFSDHVPGR